jgi:two-component system OmpR family response regulator
MSKKRILVVDDEAPITRQLKKLLEQTGKYEVHAENDGRLAVAAARSFKPDLALLDVMMPDMDGGDVKTGLQQIPGLSALPIVFLTAAYRKSESNDKDVFLAKPVAMATIIACIEQQLNNGSQSRPTA